jgi:zinc transporter ZupT
LLTDSGLLLFCAAAFAVSLAGIALSPASVQSRKILPLSGLLLLLVSLVWVLPDLAEDFGWLVGAGLMLAGSTLLAVIDRYIYPVCPTCSHTHDHGACITRLHGFAGPLLTATAIHGFFDGWSLAAADMAGRYGVWTGVLVHKLPESLAFGILLRAAMRSKKNAVVAAALAQLAMFAGALLEGALAPHIGLLWVQVLLALAGGTFLYLGGHAVHGEWKRRRALAAGGVRH